MVINPFVLATGAVLFIGGTIIAGWLIDSDIEALLKNGPFGTQQGEVGILNRMLGDDQRFAHLNDPDKAYKQLLGVLGKPVIRVERLTDWFSRAPKAQRQMLEHIISRRSQKIHSRTPVADQSLDGDDWVVILRSPLLAMFGREQQYSQTLPQTLRCTLLRIRPLYSAAGDSARGARLCIVVTSQVHRHQGLSGQQAT